MSTRCLLSHCTPTTASTCVRTWWRPLRPAAPLHPFRCGAAGAAARIAGATPSRPVRVSPTPTWSPAWDIGPFEIRYRPVNHADRDVRDPVQAGGGRSPLRIPVSPGRSYRGDGTDAALRGDLSIGRGHAAGPACFRSERPSTPNGPAWTGWCDHIPRGRPDRHLATSVFCFAGVPLAPPAPHYSSDARVRRPHP